MRQRIGLAILIVAVIVTAIYMSTHKGNQASSPAESGAAPIVDVKGYIGGEKMGFIQDPQVTQLLADKYGIRVDATKMGSIDMVSASTATEDRDFLWPSSEVALELYKNRGGKLVRSDVIFNSPIVLYSWDTITDALIKAGIVQKIDATYYVVDFPKLIKVVDAGTKWT